MATKFLDKINWFIDNSSNEINKPGIIHSYMASLATALNYKSNSFDPAWLMGASGFAFRIWINETMCPSAMSIFDFRTILPEAVENAGHKCHYFSRLWDETDIEEEKRVEAQSAIIKGINDDCPAIVWDIHEAEWGLLIGYNDDKARFSALSNSGQPVYLLYNKLGKNGIDILSVSIPAEANKKSKEEIITTSLKTAVKHAEQNEWTERPKYENGLLAYDMWAQIFDRWALLIESGGIKNIGVDLVSFARYYSSHYASARCYARDYLNQISDGNNDLIQAADSYKKVADCLLEVWKQSPDRIDPEINLLRSISQNIKDTKSSEEEGIAYIKKYLKMKKSMAH